MTFSQVLLAGRQEHPYFSSCFSALSFTSIVVGSLQDVPTMVPAPSIHASVVIPPYIVLGLVRVMSRIYRSNSNIRDTAASILHSHCLSPHSYLLNPSINCSEVNHDMNNLMKRPANMTRNWNLSTVTWVRLKKILQPHSSLWRLQLGLTPWPQPHERLWARTMQLSHLHSLRIQEFSEVPIFFQKYCFPAWQNSSPFPVLAAKNFNWYTDWCHEGNTRDRYAGKCS